MKGKFNKQYRDEFVNKIASAAPLVELFSHMHDIDFFIKDHEGVFIAANPSQVQKMGLSSVEKLIGKNDHDLFPNILVLDYSKDDQRVMLSGEPIYNKIELVSDPSGRLDWNITSKVPLYSETHKVIGIAGITRELAEAATTFLPYQEMNLVIEFINKHYQDTIQIETLANLCGLSISRFEKKFKEIFNINPNRFIIRFRITKACQALTHTQHNISFIAHDVGFYDHSHFSKAFHKIIGIYPGEYRRRHLANLRAQQ